MYKYIVTVDTDTGIVKSDRLVGADCQLSDSCHVVPHTPIELLGAVFDAKNKRFLDVNDNTKIIHKYE